MSAITKFLAFLLLGLTTLYAMGNDSSKALRWLDAKTEFFHEKIFANISPPQGMRGTVVAAQKSNTGPDYQYHWVRDAGVVMIALIDSYQSAEDEAHKDYLRRTINDYVDFSTYIQTMPAQADLGEPKFQLNGAAYDLPWGRPQNDGPALRAISLIHWARMMLAENQLQYVNDKLYNNKFPANTPIKKDLEYISHHWKDPSFDLWEETKGTHFYTLMVIRRALLEGAELAERLDDHGAAIWYHSQAKQIELELDHFWDEKNGYIKATINRVGGIDYKLSNLDTAVILGLLHGGMHDEFLAWDNPKVIATMIKLTATFKSLYPVNQYTIPGVAIGRYPEDRYSGTSFDGGNPWPLCTLALAEGWYQYASLLKKRNLDSQLALTNASKLVERVKYHAYKDGSVDEQIDRTSGYMTSAHNLTWNYAALLTTRRAAMMAER